MNAKDETEILRAAAEVTKGSGTPDSARIRATPQVISVRVLALAGPAISAMIFVAMILLAGTGYYIWKIQIIPPVFWHQATDGGRVQGIVWIALALCTILGVVTFRLASGGLRKVDARVGPAGITVESGDTEPDSPEK